MSTFFHRHWFQILIFICNILHNMICKNIVNDYFISVPSFPSHNIINRDLFISINLRYLILFGNWLIWSFTEEIFVVNIYLNLVICILCSFSFTMICIFGTDRSTALELSLYLISSNKLPSGTTILIGAFAAAICDLVTLFGSVNEFAS